MTATTAAHRAAEAVSSTPTTIVIEIDDSFAPLFAELAEASLARKEAENREKEIKALLMAEVPGVEDHGDKVTFALRTPSGGLRGKVTKRSRSSIDAKLLAESYPEAYEATLGSSSYQVFTP